MSDVAAGIDRGPVSILGAGPTGVLLAILLQRRGFTVSVFESREDPRAQATPSGRSINLALADRGITALRTAGLFDRIAGAMLPMRGRLIHPKGGTPSLQLYGRRASEVIYSISRHRLNQELLSAAIDDQGIDVHFEHRLESADLAVGEARLRDLRSGKMVIVPMTPLLAADGAGSPMRRRLSALGLIEATEQDLDHAYKELSIPAGADGEHLLVKDALHIWPRGNFMLIALPNADGSFTATLFLPKHGPASFAALTSAGVIDEFFRIEFADAHALMPNCVSEFQNNPTGFLGTVHATPWHAGNRAALIGDAAHAIVPFHGQGMNCCFEDCLEFDACLARGRSWPAAFEDFFRARKPNTDAIAEMALENYLEMRARVASPIFQLQQSLALELERRHPERFVPRYSMVTFHHEIPYATALARGAVQSRLLEELTVGAHTLGDVDFDRAAREIDRRLPALPDQGRSKVMKL
ncbi:MAG: FAD-dependent monooxygenase [Pseudomonadota bacterium]|nr:FAD-dependent monooxygenase [Pseudomonadota bacterium]